MPASKRDLIWKRARGRCEYCRLAQDCDVQPFQIDHVRPRKHAGRSTIGNLALSCLPCNSYKGSNVAGYDPETGELHPLFNPRTDDWDEHFEYDGAVLLGKTGIGRTTIDVLRINLGERVAHRRLLIEIGAF